MQVGKRADGGPEGRAVQVGLGPGEAQSTVRPSRGAALGPARGGVNKWSKREPDCGISELRPGHELGRVICEPVATWRGRDVPVVTGPRKSHPLEVHGDPGAE